MPQPSTPRTPLTFIRAGLVVALAFASVGYLLKSAFVFPMFVDLEIPLRAAERWLAGGSPYLASAFTEPPGYSLPFLYAPPTLPFFALLAQPPRSLAYGSWFVACLVAATFGARRLGVPWRALPFVLCWPPFAGSLIGGNVQVFLFGSLIAVFWRRADKPWRPAERDIALVNRPAATGSLAAFIPAMKLALPHAWVTVIPRRPLAAASGVVVCLGVALFTLPLLGLPLWGDWIGQVRHALDPAWTNGGYRLVPGMPVAITTAAWLISVVSCLLMRPTRPGTWSALLGVLGAASLHVFSLLFVLPALLVVRREIALVAATLAALADVLGTGWALWAGALIPALALALGDRWPALLEPETGGDGGLESQRAISNSPRETPPSRR